MSRKKVAIVRSQPSRIGPISPSRVGAAYLVCTLLLAPTLIGCGGVKEERIKVSVSNDPLEQPRSLLKRYADGQPLGSEATMFSSMVESVKKSDPKRGEVLETGLKKLQEASAEERASIANELLKQLQPSMTGS